MLRSQSPDDGMRRVAQNAGNEGKARLVVLAREIGERFLDEMANAVWHQLQCGTCHRSCRVEPTPRGCGGGVRFLHAPLLGPLLSPSQQKKMATRRPCTKCWGTPATSSEGLFL